ncbi:zinc finger protein ZAT3-like [Forsythia ovata]|uniref:Zinc finger protein ZAT3-like n=1 Tax=Forsythia ovata TaxID=205694 RepID=A0ABD1QAC4_9LAMI
MEKDDRTTGSQEKDKMNNKVCPVCNKAFSSGKALGGHMRIHVQAKKDLTSIRKKKVNQSFKSKKRLREDEEISAAGFVKKKNYNKKLTCSICGKNFPSMKSLCGHMRCHPERNWKGIQPPTIAINIYSSKIEHKNVDNQIDSLTDADGNQTIDSTESFRDLSVTAKRGRMDTRSTSEFSGSEDDQLYDAVLDLMTLARGDSLESGLIHRQRVVESEATNSNSLTYKSGIGDTNQVSEWKNPKEERGSTNLERLQMSSNCLIDAEKEKTGHLLRTSVVIEEHEQKYCESSNAKTTIKNKKRRKKVRLSELESGKYADPVTPVDQNLVGIPVTKPPHDKYRCITCGKCFQTHQALGGHRASHNKSKSVNYNPIDQSSFAASEDERLSTPIAQVDDETKEIAHECHRILDFDLNEVPPLEDEAGVVTVNFDFASS